MRTDVYISGNFNDPLMPMRQAGLKLSDLPLDLNEINWDAVKQDAVAAVERLRVFIMEKD